MDTKIICRKIDKQLKREEKDIAAYKNISAMLNEKQLVDEAAAAHNLVEAQENIYKNLQDIKASFLRTEECK
jgi:hypothetical protein